MPLVHLITFADVTARTVVALGSEPHKFTVAIPRAEQRHLRPVLGPALYDQLRAFVEANPLATTGPLAALAAEVKDMLASWAVVEAWPSLLGHIEAAGFVTKVGKSEGTSTADVQLADRTLADLRETAGWQSGELARWLAARAADYPDWAAPGGAPATEMLLGGLLL
ncbi:DUF6712 family protein [Hymenobacter sp.]|uniref:DUF6712 family protein n=1 Tax=Hymenobacter sp. TaxID=1898978 RepID=UPI00286BA99C|nr:DUF6712 family protein [Hymenobacter sp.]